MGLGGKVECDVFGAQLCDEPYPLSITVMLDEDVFDSVTWESPSAPVYDYTPSSGPGYRQSIDSSEGGPHDPKWEGYLITAVTDPQKELAETKDAYVSYQISAKVCQYSPLSLH